MSEYTPQHDREFDDIERMFRAAAELVIAAELDKPFAARDMGKIAYFDTRATSSQVLYDDPNHA